MWHKGSTREIDGKTYFGHFTSKGWVAECEVILIAEEFDEETNTRHLRYARLAALHDSDR